MGLFHALNRGVDKRKIVLDNEDRARFVHDLFEFNDTKPAGSTYYSFEKHLNNILDLRSPDIRKREKIVDIHGWCLMDNHYHLLLSPITESGITLFIRKLNIGYAKYFNKKYTRSGTLFQGRTKKKLIDNNSYFLHILNYIHLNPLDYLKETKEWRKRHIKSATRAVAYLEQYRWSSYLDYCGKRNFPSILTTTLFNDNQRIGSYKHELQKYLEEIEPDMTESPLLIE